MHKFIVFESVPKCGKTTLCNSLSEELKKKNNEISVFQNRGALSNSSFSKHITSSCIYDISYSTAFFWADLIFDTADNILPVLRRNGIVIQDRYDLSIVTYREIHGLNQDYILLEEYLKREMILTPDLTIFLQPNYDVIRDRLRNSNQLSFIDEEFLKFPENINIMQERIEYHLKRLNRHYMVINTGEMKLSKCVSYIMSKLNAL